MRHFAGTFVPFLEHVHEFRHPLETVQRCTLDIDAVIEAQGTKVLRYQTQRAAGKTWIRAGIAEYMNHKLRWKVRECNRHHADMEYCTFWVERDLFERVQSENGQYGAELSLRITLSEPLQASKVEVGVWYLSVRTWGTVYELVGVARTSSRTPMYI